MISEIKFKDDILQDLHLDFKNNNTQLPYNTIIIAGENGIGKTTILQRITDVLDLKRPDKLEYMKYTINDINYEMTFSYLDNHSHNIFIKNLNNTSEEKLKIFEIITAIDQKKLKTEDLRKYGFSYSKAKSGFGTKSIKSSTTETIDQSSRENDNNDDYTSIKQLLVDVIQSDSTTFANKSKNKEICSWDVFEKESMQFRFKKAFDNFFENMTFEGIDANNHREKQIIFMKNKKKINIDDLSTGEKQIVFRGTLLLKNLNSIKGGIVLIDEPELSLHPRWQHKILQYYRDLFTIDNEQIVQIIMVTHSEKIITSALENKKEILTIVLNEQCCNIMAKRLVEPNILPIMTAAEANYIAFNIISVDLHIALYNHIQVISGKEKVKECDEYICGTKEYNSIHEKKSKHRNTKYNTICTYIRNQIHHPVKDEQECYTNEELELSVKLMIEICKNNSDN